VKRAAIMILTLAFMASPGWCATVLAGGTTNDTEGRIIRLSDGRLMAAIARNPYGSWSSTDVYVSFSPDDGSSWTAPALAVGGAADQATLAALQLPGDTVRIWFASNESGTYRIHTAWSADGASWTAEGQVALGWGASVQCYDPAVVLEPDSSLTMIYRGGSGTAAGAYVSHRPKGGGWDTLRRPVNYRAYRPRIMRHADGTYLAAFQRQSGGSSTQIDIFVRRSTDLNSWTDSVRLTTNQNSHDAFCLWVPDSGYVVYYAKYQNAPYDAYNLCRRRSEDGISWGPERQLTFDGSLKHNTQPCLFHHAGAVYLAWARANDYDNDNDVLFERTQLTGVAARPPEPVRGRELRAWPNPCWSGQSLNLDFNGDSHGPGSIGIYDVSGRLARSISCGNGAGGVSVRTEGLAPGVYIIRCMTGRGGCLKLVVAR